MTTQEQVDRPYALPAEFEYPEPRAIGWDELDAMAEGLAKLKWVLSDDYIEGR